MEQYPENYRKQLEQLLNIVNDGKEGYLKAAEYAHSEHLKEIFLRFSKEREHMAEELKERLLHFNGDTNNTRGDKAGLVHRALMSFKTAFTKGEKDDQAVLESCRTGDQAALEMYDDILQGSILETDLKAFLTGQRFLISQAFYEVDELYFNKFKTNPEV